MESSALVCILEGKAKSSTLKFSLVSFANFLYVLTHGIISVYEQAHCGLVQDKCFDECGYSATE